MRISDWSSDVCSSDLHQLDAEAFASEIMAKPLSVRRSLNAQGLGKPEMVPCSKLYSDGHAWVVDRQGPVEHRAHCGARFTCELISNGIWVGHDASDGDVRITSRGRQESRQVG